MIPGGKNKGGGGPIYNPQGTPLLETGLTGMALGTALQTAPGFQSLLETQAGKDTLAKLGLTPEGIQSLAPKFKQVDYGGLLKQAQGLPTSNVNKLSGNVWSPGQSFQFQPQGQNFQYQQPGQNFQYQQPGQGFQFQQPEYRETQFAPRDVTGVPKEVYEQQRSQVFEDVARQQKQALDASRLSMARSGLSRSGFAGGREADIARSGMETTARLSRDIGERQATQALDTSKFQAGLGFQAQQAQAQENKFASELSRWRQQQQAAENQYRSGLGFQSQQAQAAENLARSGLGFQTQQAQAAENLARTGIGFQTQQAQAAEDLARNRLLLEGGGQQFQQNLAAQQNQFTQMMQRIGLQGTLQQQAAAQSQQPFDMLRQLYGMNIGIPVTPSQPKGDPLSALLQAGGAIGAAKYAAPAVAAACLPRGTMIELPDGGSRPVEQISVGDDVLGGRIVATTSIARPKGHTFYRHRFGNGRDVVMSLGHPSFDAAEVIEMISHDSPCTHDILTDGGFYYVNGVQLGSTIGRGR